MTSIIHAHQSRRRKMTALNWWFVAACLLFAMISSQPFVSAGELSPTPAEMPTPRGQVITISDVVNNDGDRDDEDAPDEDNEDEIEAEDQKENENEEKEEEKEEEIPEKQEAEKEEEKPSDGDEKEKKQQDAGDEMQQDDNDEQEPGTDEGGPPTDEMQEAPQKENDDKQEPGTDEDGPPTDEMQEAPQKENDEDVPDDDNDLDGGPPDVDDPDVNEDDRDAEDEPDSPTGEEPDAPDAPTDNEPDAPTDAPPPTASPTDGPSPTVSPTQDPTALPTGPPPTEQPQPEPTPDTWSPAPTVSPPETEPPSPEPTKRPTRQPETDPPTEPPTETDPPTEPPTEPPPETEPPSPEPTKRPTAAPETSEPTDSPTKPPTLPPATAFPTVSPTFTPSATPTVNTQPTTAPSPMPNPAILIEDNVSVIISPVSGGMSAGNADHFQTTAMTFLADLLIQLEQPIYNVDVSVTGGNILTRQRRLQADAMQIDMVVSGNFDPVQGLAETEEDYSIGRVARQFFTVQGDSFVRMLQEADNEEDAAYFEAVSAVESVADPEDDITPAEAPAPPGSAPATGNEPGLAIGGIVAVALVGALVVALGAALLVHNLRKRRRNNPLDRSMQDSASSKKKSSKRTLTQSSSRESNRQNGGLSPTSPEMALSEAPPPVLTIGGPSSDRGSIDRVDSDVQSDLQWGAESLIGAESNMSYAYSLEDGIQQSPSGESISSDVNYEKDAPVPTEIPNIASTPSEEEQNKNDDDDELDIDKSWTPNSNSIIREITAPAGKLGLVLHTSEKGPVVQSVAAGSPLEGMVWPGDVIISIDGKKTRKMSAASVTEYMSNNLFKKRTLMMMSDPDA